MQSHHRHSLRSLLLVSAVVLVDTVFFTALTPLLPHYVSTLGLSKTEAGVLVAASDYVSAYPQLIAAYVEARFVALGTDGFGRSDTRQALRSFFEVDRRHIVVAALACLKDQGVVSRETLADAIGRFGIDGAAAPPWTI